MQTTKSNAVRYTVANYIACLSHTRPGIVAYTIFISLMLTHSVNDIYTEHVKFRFANCLVRQTMQWASYWERLVTFKAAYKATACSDDSASLINVAAAAKYHEAYLPYDFAYVALDVSQLLSGLLWSRQRLFVYLSRFARRFHIDRNRPRIDCPVDKSGRTRARIRSHCTRLLVVQSYCQTTDTQRVGNCLRLKRRHDSVYKMQAIGINAMVHAVLCIINSKPAGL